MNFPRLIIPVVAAVAAFALGACQKQPYSVIESIDNTVYHHGHGPGHGAEHGHEATHGAAHGDQGASGHKAPEGKEGSKIQGSDKGGESAH